MVEPTPIVCALDVQAPVKSDEVEGLVPGRREPRWLRLSEHLGPASGAAGLALAPPYDWTALGRAVVAVGAAVKAASASAGDGGVHVYVAGRAPLPLFAQLGQLLNFAPTPHRTVLNPRRGGPWESFPMAGSAPTEGPFFDRIDGLDRVQINTGRVAIFVSTLGTAAPIDAIARLLEARGDSIAGLVELQTTASATVTPEQMPAIADELRERLSQVPGAFPRAGRFALFLAVPAQVAFAVGQAVNPNVFGRDVWLAHYTAPDYEHAGSLPFAHEGAPPVPDGDGDRLARHDVMAAILDGINELRRTLEPDDLAASGADEAQRARWIRDLGDLRIPREPEGEAFGLSVLRRQLSLGKGLLEAMRGRPAEVQRGFGQLLVLHELFHDDQDVRSSNYVGIGRAGTVLEDVDFAADAFALAALVRWDLRRGGARKQEEAGAVAAAWVGFALAGIEAFDRLEQGDRIERLHERRLRRYLIWHLNRERARTVRPGADARGDVAWLFRGRLAVELAPLPGHLDPQFDKVVTRATPHTELFAALDGHLVREAPRRGFDPGGLVDLVRTYDGTAIARALCYVLDQHRAVLAPWTLERGR